MEPQPGTYKPNMSRNRVHPLKGTLAVLCQSERTKERAWTYYEYLKTVRTGPDVVDLPLGYMSICAYLASQKLGEHDVEIKKAFEKSEVKTEDTFWRNVDEVEEILLEASRISQPTTSRLHYSRMDMYPHPCSACEDRGLPCYRVQRKKGVRTSKKCMACYHTSRPCKLPPSRDKHDEEEDQLSDDDSDWQPNTTKTIQQRVEKIENRGKKPAQKKVTKRTDCPPLAPLNASSSKANPHSTIVAASHSTARQFASSSSQPAKEHKATPMKRTQTNASSSNPTPAQRPQASPAKASAKKAAGLLQNPTAHVGCSKAAQQSSQQAPTAPTVEKHQPASSLQALRKPGPGRSSLGLVPPGSEPADAPPTSSSTAPAVEATPVAGPSSAATQCHTTVRVVKKERLSSASKQSSGRTSPTSPSGTQAPAHPMPSVKQERSGSGSGLTLGSAPERRVTATQAPAAPQLIQASAPAPPASSSQVMRPAETVLGFGLGGGSTSYGSVDIPTSLEPAIDSGPPPRLSSRGRLVASPKTNSSHVEAGQAKPRDWTSPKRPLEEKSTQALKRRRISAVDPSATTLPDDALQPKPTSTSAPVGRPVAQPTPPQSRKPTPIAGSSASQPPSPILAPTQPPAAPPLSAITSYIVQEIGELPRESHSSAQTRLPTPISPLSRSATLPPQDPVAPSGAHVEQPADAYKALPTPRASMSAAMPTPPPSAGDQPRAEPPVADQDVVMQDVAAPPPTPSGTRTPQLPAWVQQPAVVPPPASAPPQVAPSAPVPAPAPAPAQPSVPPPAPPASAPPAPSSSAQPAAPTVHAQYIQLVYDKAKEILAHVPKQPCVPLELQYDISDMRRRVTKIDERRARGADVSAFADMLLRAGLAVAAKRRSLRECGKPLEDDMLDMLVEELEERLEDMQRQCPLGGAVGPA